MENIWRLFQEKETVSNKALWLKSLAFEVQKGQYGCDEQSS